MSDRLNGVLGSPALPLEGTFDGPVVRGYSAYAIAVQNGFIGTIEEWLESLKGEKGDKGDPGDKGDSGDKGDPGPKGDKGDPGTDGDDGVGIASIELDPDYGLRITLTDGSIYTTSSVRGPQGEPGIGIRNIQMNSDYTITFTLTNGGSYTTPPARGAKGEQGVPGPKGEKGDKGDPGESFSVHICSTSEYDQQTGIPTIQNPDPKVLYLVPSAAGMPPDLFVEWMYVANTWEIFGTATVDVSTKADKVTNATSGNFAGLDSNGNLTDSGHKHSDYITQHQDITGKADKVQNATSGNLAGLDSNGNLYDSGNKPSDFLTQHQDISGKADKVQNATSGNFAGLDSNGNLADSGHSFSEINQELTSVKSDLNDLSDAVDDKYEKPSSGIPASDIASGVIPDVPVTDVQVNGTSVLGQDGVANVPVASASEYGVVKVNVGSTGIGLSSSGALNFAKATEAQIKAGTNFLLPFTVSNQHIASFYGLAKAAGADMASSSNAVGTYTDEAKIAIQKMLGIYEAPWELIREDTFTNATEGEHSISVDGNGDSFELTDAIFMFELPSQANEASVGASGGILFNVKVNGASVTAPKVEIGGWTQSANALAHGGSCAFLRTGNLIQIYRVGQNSVSNTGTFGAHYGEGFKQIGSSDRISFSITNDVVYVTGMTIVNVKGTGHYKLYGKRKWS